MHSLSSLTAMVRWKVVEHLYEQKNESVIHQYIGHISQEKYKKSPTIKYCTEIICNCANPDMAVRSHQYFINLVLAQSK